MTTNQSPNRRAAFEAAEEMMDVYRCIERRQEMQPIPWPPMVELVTVEDEAALLRHARAIVAALETEHG